MFFKKMSLAVVICRAFYSNEDVSVIRNLVYSIKASAESSVLKIFLPGTGVSAFKKRENLDSSLLLKIKFHQSNFQI